MRVRKHDCCGCADWGVYCLLPLRHRNLEFESYSINGQIYRSFMFSLCCPLWAETLWWAYSSFTKLLIQAAVHCVPKYCPVHNATSRVVCSWWWMYRVQLIAYYPVNVMFLVSHNSSVREVHCKVRSRNLAHTFGENNLIAFRMSVKKYFCLHVYYTHSYNLYFVTCIF